MPAYKALGQWHEITLIPLNTQAPSLPRSPRIATMVANVLAPAVTMASERDVIAQAVEGSPVLKARILNPRGLAVVQGTVAARPNAGARSAGRIGISNRAATTFITEMVIAEGVRQADLAAAKSFGASVVDEGLDGKILFRVDSIDKVFGLVNLLLEREVGSASPNFLRRVAPLPRSKGGQEWSHRKIGVDAAWAITKGNREIAVAVLDEGVDTTHPALRPALQAQRDFIGNNGNSAMPDGNDAHGTACSGIVVSRDASHQGIAPDCSLIAARIAMDDGAGHWIFDDYSAADAIDWSWRQGAAVLSNSWGGGAPSDAISRAFARARTQGRNGLGAVVVIAAGNDQQLIDFPGNLPGYVTVGASNPEDERKTRTSSDGETWWGSNFGPTMQLLAPGVFIWTTDIVGPAGYESGDFTEKFNGTSSATPAVAGAAALMLSANPALSGSSVRDLLAKTAKKLKGQSGWTPELGWGRLDVGAAVAAAKVAGTVQTPAPKTKRKMPRKTAKR